MLALLALFSVQTADQETVRLCVPAPEGHVMAELGFVPPDDFWRTPPSDRAASRQRFDASMFPTAAAGVGSSNGSRSRVGGATFRYAEQHQASWAFNRYYLEHPPVDGVAAVVLLGSRDDTLLILTDPVGCGFAEYRLESDR